MVDLIHKKLEKVEVVGDQIRVTVLIDNEKLINEYFDGDYEVSRGVREKVVPEVVKAILEKHEDEIVEQCLKDVNWTEIVRSEIAQEVIKTIANKQNRGY